MELIKGINYSAEFIERIVLHNSNEEIFIYTNNNSLDHMDKISKHIPLRKDINVYILILLKDIVDIDGFKADIRFRYRGLLSKPNVSMYVLNNILNSFIPFNSTIMIGSKFGQLVLDEDSYFDEKIKEEFRNTIYIGFRLKNIVKINKL